MKKSGRDRNSGEATLTYVHIVPISQLGREEGGGGLAKWILSARLPKIQYPPVIYTSIEENRGAGEGQRDVPKNINPKQHPPNQGAIKTYRMAEM